MAGHIRVRRSTLAAWTSDNPTLLSSERAFVTDLGLFKTGPGAFNSIRFDLESGRRAVKTLVNGGYSFLRDDGVGRAEVTTGAYDRTLDFSDLVAAADYSREVDLEKIDTGVGEVVIDAGVDNLVYWPGGGSQRTVRVGLQHQHTKVRVVAGGLRIVGGVVQPVALEPDIGGGWHQRTYANRSITPLVGSSTNTGGTWSAAVTVPALPDGVLAIYSQLMIQIVSGTGMVAVERASGVTLDPINIGNAYRRYSFVRQDVNVGGNMLKIPLDGSKQFKWCPCTTNTGIELNYPTEYLLGPA